MPKEPEFKDGPKPASGYRTSQEARWLEENRAALDAANALVESRGLPLGHHRKF